MPLNFDQCKHESAGIAHNGFVKTCVLMMKETLETMMENGEIVTDERLQEMIAAWHGEFANGLTSAASK